MMLNIGTWKNMSALSSSASPGRGTVSSGYLPQLSADIFCKSIFRRKRLVLADHVPGTQDYSGMSFEGLRAAFQILSEVHPVVTKPHTLSLS